MITPALIGTIFFALLTLFIIDRMYSKGITDAQKTIMQAFPQGAIIINKTGTIVFINANAEKLLHTSGSETIGKHIDNALPLQSNGKNVTSGEWAALIENNSESVFRYKTLDAKEVPLSLALSPITYGNDEKSTLITVRNISEKKQLEEMKVDFVSMAAHELRTPLTAIRGYTSLLQMHYANDMNDQAKELLIRLLISTTNLSSLIDNLLLVSRIERNDMLIEKQPINIALILNDVFENFKQQANTKKLTFLLNIPKEELPLVMVDPFKIGQVFFNLISNAINYTPEKGTVVVTAARKADSVEITIQDTGQGIPSEAIPMLFTKFFRVSGALEQGSKGTGLGLYITKSILELHDGKIFVESTLGKGSKFTCSLPIATTKMIDDQQQKTNNASLTAKNGQAIIVKKTSNNSSLPGETQT